MEAVVEVQVEAATRAEEAMAQVLQVEVQVEDEAAVVMAAAR